MSTWVDVATIANATRISRRKTRKALSRAYGDTSTWRGATLVVREVRGRGGRSAQDDWRAVADIRQLVDELSASSPDFKAMWDDNEIAGARDSVKRLHPPVLGAIEMEFSTFAVEGRSDLNMMVCSPASPEVMEQFRALITGARRAMTPGGPDAGKLGGR
jgi:hypothetical protein